MYKRKAVFYCVVLLFLICFGLVGKSEASFTQIPFEFESYSSGALDWFDYGDDVNTGSVAMGFSVTIGGATYDHFDMDSNGYVQLLSGSQSETNYGYGSIDDLISEDPASTYLLAAYDDLDSSYYNYFGYKAFGDRVVFYYDTETYADGDSDYPNNFEMILFNNGNVKWNFNYADYESYDYDLFSGLYFGNTQTKLTLYDNYIPTEESWLYRESAGNAVPEPTTLSLLGLGLLGLAFKKKKA